QRSYLADPSRVDLRARKGPSTIAACQICAGVTAVDALKLLLGRGEVLKAPWGYQFDAYRNRLKRTWRPGGHRNPLQRIGLWLGRRQLQRMKNTSEAGHE
nr:ThiF family adenylyltransferase [Thauera sp.]